MPGYPADPVLLSDVRNWISARALQVRPYQLVDPDAELLSALKQGRLAAFARNGKRVAPKAWVNPGNRRWGDRVVSRVETLTLWPDVPQRMSADEFGQYTLLWDAADNMACCNGQTPDRNWLALMDAFWQGELAPRGLTYFYPAPSPGQEFVNYDYHALVDMLLDHRAVENGYVSVDSLRHWRLADYQNLPPQFRIVFERDLEGRLGLALLTVELDAWRQGRDRKDIQKIRKKPGPKGEVRKRLKDKMLVDLRTGRRKVTDLQEYTLLLLTVEYGGSQNTANNARKEAIAQFNTEQKK